MTADWPVEHLRGSAADFHRRELPDPVRRAVWWFDVERPAVVLGSTQDAAVVDDSAAAAAGVEVARRRSGGGAVHLVPGAVTWVDVVIPADDAHWVADVGRAFGWLGAAWVEVLARLGEPGARAHEGPLVRTRWSDLVCFAGVGPGEVLVDGRKVVGMAQRRTRAGARFQCAVLHHWEPDALLDLLALPPADRAAASADLADRARGLAPTSDAVVDALRAVLAAPA